MFWKPSLPRSLWCCSLFIIPLCGFFFVVFFSSQEQHSPVAERIRGGSCALASQRQDLSVRLESGDTRP